MYKKEYLFTLNNVRGLRRFIDLRKNLRKREINLKLITSSLSTYLIVRFLFIDAQFLLNKNKKLEKDFSKLFNNFNNKLLISSIKAEYDQEIKYKGYFKKSMLIARILKSIHIYINTYNLLNKKKNVKIIGFNSNIINQISICLAAKETQNYFYSIVPIDPPSLVGITEGFPYLREIILDEIDIKKSYYSIKKFKNKGKYIPKYRLTSYSYLNKFEIILRKSLSRILIHFDNLYFYLFSLSTINDSLKKKVLQFYREIKEKKEVDKVSYWLTDLNSGEIRLNEKGIKLFDGDLKNKNINYHIFYCSCPLESENYFLGMCNEYECLTKLSKLYFPLKNNLFIARLHPGWEHKYNKNQLVNLSNNGALIWDKRKCYNFKVNNDSNIFKYTTCGTIFLESLGEKSPCLITSDAFRTCKEFLNQPSILQSDKIESYSINWQKNSKKLKFIINNSCWDQDYYDPKLKYSEEIISKIVRIIN